MLSRFVCRAWEPFHLAHTREARITVLQGVVYHDMLWDADVYLGELIDLLKKRQMWDNLVVICATLLPLSCRVALGLPCLCVAC